jgi:hypothetical protein
MLDGGVPLGDEPKTEASVYTHSDAARAVAAPTLAAKNAARMGHPRIVFPVQLCTEAHAVR